MKIEHYHNDSLYLCDLKYCRSKITTEIYVLTLTKAEYKDFGLDKKIKKSIVGFSDRLNVYFAQMCPKHFKAFLEKNKGKIAFSLV